MPLVHKETICAGSPTPSSSSTSTSPPPPPLSMISATLCRSVQIESGMDEDEATWLGDLCSSDYRLGCRGDRQTDGRGKAGLAVCPGCTPPSLSLPPSCLVLWLLHSHTLHCARLTFPPFMAWACFTRWHTFVIAWLHLLLSLLVLPPLSDRGLVWFAAGLQLHKTRKWNIDK